MKSLRRFAANDLASNPSYNFRKKRIRIFNVLLANVNKEIIYILDIGGSSDFWNFWEKHLSYDIKITLINLSFDVINKNRGIVGDATNLSFIRDKKFDIILSNSLIEHLYDFDNQMNFAKEIKRIGDFYFIQTPAYLFPLEPHFLFPFFHWFPKKVRIFLHRNFNLGWYKAEPDYMKAKKNVDEIRLLKKKEITKMFPNSKIIVERLFLFPKSYIITNMVK